MFAPCVLLAVHHVLQLRCVLLAVRADSWLLVLARRAQLIVTHALQPLLAQCAQLVIETKEVPVSPVISPIV